MKPDAVSLPELPDTEIQARWLVPHPFDQAGEQGDGGEVVAEPGAAAFGERGQGVVDEVLGVVAAVRAGAACGHRSGC